MKYRQMAADLIKQFEGLSLSAYKCPAGVWTIGYGSTRGVTQGMTITKDEAEQRLFEDMKDAEEAVNRYVTVPVTDGQRAALVSFAFNVGSGNLQRSTLLRRLNARQYDLAADEFPKWNKAAGRELVGLTRRRVAEQEMFENG
jgi:lysozyme